MCVNNLHFPRVALDSGDAGIRMIVHNINIIIVSGEAIMSAENGANLWAVGLRPNPAGRAHSAPHTP